MMSSLFPDLGGGPSLKNAPLLPASSQSKVKKEPRTYIFDLELGESTDQTYPEFSWADLVKDAKALELEDKKKKGVTILDPYATDDEDDLKAMAAKFEEKYGNQSPQPIKKKKKQKVEDVDRGAGYDENDSFIDNTDAYDERVPQEMQPACGGFYINSGQLDYKEVHISEDDDDEEEEEKEKVTKPVKPAKEKAQSNSSVPNLKSGEPIQKKRRISQDTPVNRPKIPVKGAKTKTKPSNLNVAFTKASADENATSKKRARQISSSSSSGSSSSSSSSSSSDDSSSSSENEENKKKSKIDPDIIILHSSTPPPSKNLKLKPTKNSDNLVRPTNKVSIKPTILPRRPKVKNVPLNPMLHRKEVPAAVPIKNLLPPATITPRKIIDPKDFMKSKSENLKIKHWGSSLHSNSPPTAKKMPQLTNTTPTSTGIIKVPTPKASPSFATSTPCSVISSINSPSSASFSKPSPLSISAELSQIFQESNEQSVITPNSNVSRSSTSMTSKAKQTKPSSSLASTPEALAKEILNRMVLNNAAAQKKKDISEQKQLPMLKHKSGYVLEKQSPSPNSNFSSKPVKVNVKHAGSMLNNSPITPQSYSPTTISTSSKSVMFQSSSLTTSSGVEISKSKKQMPSLGAGITVTEVKDKPTSSTNPRVMPMSANTNNFIYSNSNLKISPHSIIAQSNLTSVITSTPFVQKKSLPTNSSPLLNLSGGDLSERFSVSNFALNKQEGKTPGRITNFNVNTLLSNSNRPDIPVFKVQDDKASNVTTTIRDKK